MYTCTYVTSVLPDNYVDSTATYIADIDTDTDIDHLQLKILVLQCKDRYSL